MLTLFHTRAGRFTNAGIQDAGAHVKQRWLAGRTAPTTLGGLRHAAGARGEPGCTPEKAGVK
jgi:hypothetical protein